MDLKERLAKIDQTGADWIGLREVRESTTERTVRDGKPEENHTVTSHGYMVEVLVGGNIAYAASSDWSTSALQEAKDRALRTARSMANFGVHQFSTDQRPKSIGTFDSPFETPLREHSPRQISDLLIRACDNMKVSDKIVRRMSSARFIDSRHRYVSSNGTDVTQNFNLLSLDFSSTAQDGSNIQCRTHGGLTANSYQMGLEGIKEETFLEKARQVAEESVELLSAEECPTETCSLVLNPEQMMLQIHESIGHPLEIDRIMGDERNYAGSSFVKLEDFGSLQYGSSIMNVTFDPTMQGEFATYDFDDNAHRASKEYLIKSGKLVRGLGGLESQVRSGVPGVANSRASDWNRAPIDRMANINLEAGSSSRDEIIGSIERGVLMLSNRSWSIDDYRRKFQFGCEYGKLIENGKITKTVRNPNYRGISVPFWNSLSMIGDSSTFQFYGTPYCGKGEPNQVIRVGHGSPLCLFDNIEVFGGAE